MMAKAGGEAFDAYGRMNFLYQSAHHVLNVNPTNTELVRYYIHTMKTIAKRKVLRLDPSIKRTVCKKCSMLLVPGISATVRLKGKCQKHINVTCLECGLLKRFPWNPKYMLWSERPEAWVEEKMDSTRKQHKQNVKERKSKSTTHQAVNMEGEPQEKQAKKSKRKDMLNSPISQGATINENKQIEVDSQNLLKKDDCKEMS